MAKQMAAFFNHKEEKCGAIPLFVDGTLWKSRWKKSEAEETGPLEFLKLQRPFNSLKIVFFLRFRR